MTVVYRWRVEILVGDDWTFVGTAQLLMTAHAIGQMAVALQQGTDYRVVSVQ